MECSRKKKSNPYVIPLGSRKRFLAQNLTKSWCFVTAPVGDLQSKVSSALTCAMPTWQQRRLFMIRPIIIHLFNSERGPKEAVPNLSHRGLIVVSSSELLIDSSPYWIDLSTCTTKAGKAPAHASLRSIKARSGHPGLSVNRCWTSNPTVVTGVQYEVTLQATSCTEHAWENGRSPTYYPGHHSPLLQYIHLLIAS
jgi:hypothetical protein